MPCCALLVGIDDFLWCDPNPRVQEASETSCRKIPRLALLGAEERGTERQGRGDSVKFSFLGDYRISSPQLSTHAHARFSCFFFL